MSRQKEIILKRLVSINSVLKGGVYGNPAEVAGKSIRLTCDFTEEEQKEVVKWFGNWMHKKEEKRVNKLKLERNELEDKLRDILNESL